jgi:hypothetical protein
MRADDLTPGERFGSPDTGVVLVLSVDHLPADEYHPHGRVRVGGRIVAGPGTARKTRFWTFHPDQAL